MKLSLALLTVSFLGSMMTINTAAAADDPLAPWRSGVTIKPVAPDAQRHSIHAYFNTCPESPDGKYVLYYTSSAKDGETGDVRILERATGKETIVATDIHTEDAHRVACQQWVNNGKTIVYHDYHQKKRWRVMAIDLATLKQTVLAEDWQLGFGSQTQPMVPVYGCHWNPGEHRDLGMVNVQTGQFTTPVTVKQVVETYGDYVQKKFETKDITVFFPVLSPDGSKVFFKLARPSGGDDFRSMHASFRDGKVVYDLANNKFIRLIDSWGHPSWDATSTSILEKGQVMTNMLTGKSERYCPSSPSDHPSMNPTNTLYVTDANVTKRPFGKPGDWAIVVGGTTKDEFVVVAQFNHTNGAASWRLPHPHPQFSADGKRIYYNASGGGFTRLFVAEASDPSKDSKTE